MSNTNEKPLLIHIPVKDIEENPVALRECDKKNEQFIELCDSVKEVGVLKSITVMRAYDSTNTEPRQGPDGNPIYVLIDGLQRLTASKMTGKDTIPAQVLTASQARALKLQVILNTHTVETKRAELAKHLIRIMAEDSTATAAQLSKDLQKSTEWLSETLGLAKLSEEIAKEVDEGKISVSNAIELAKLDAEDQEAFRSRAKCEPTAVFGPAVKARVKEIRDAQRAGRKPGEVKAFEAVAHQRPFGEVKGAWENPAALIEYAQRSGASTVEDAVKFVLKWATHMDETSIAAAKAKAEARKQQDEAEKAKRKEDRDAQKAKEAEVLKKLRDEQAKTGALAAQ